MTNKDNLEQFLWNYCRVVIMFIDKLAHKTYWQCLKFYYYLSIFCTVVFFYNNRTVPNIINVERLYTLIINLHLFKMLMFAVFNSIHRVRVSNLLILTTLLFRSQWLPQLKLTLIVRFLPSENQPNLYYLNLIYCACLHCQDYCFTGVRLDMIISIRPGVI